LKKKKKSKWGKKHILGTKWRKTEGLFLDEFWHKKIVKNSIPTLTSLFQTVAHNTDFLA